MCDKVKYIGRFQKFQKRDYWDCRGCPLAPTGQIKKNDISKSSKKCREFQSSTKYLK